MTDQKIVFQASGKEAFLYVSDRPDTPLVLINEYEGDGSGIVKAMAGIGCADCSLLVVSGIDWEKEMTPWAGDPVFPGEPPYAGGADGYLQSLQDEILSEAVRILPGPPSCVCIAGYSLAGLFSLYALYRTDRFSRSACCSGSLWYPEFVDFAKTRPMERRPDRLYCSLGDREAKTRNPVMRTVADCTEELVRHYRETGIDVTFEWNPGNHFRDAELRLAKGIAALVS